MIMIISSFFTSFNFTEAVFRSEDLYQKIRKSLNHVSVLLSFFCGFPGMVPQVTASCTAQCAETCKELKSMKCEGNMGKKDTRIERDREAMRRSKSEFYIISYSISSCSESKRTKTFCVHIINR